jgi:hypothetical protein
VLHPEVREVLEWGFALFGDAVTVDIGQEWGRWGAEILQDWILARPGTRPAAWWVFAGVPAHGPRLQLRRGPAAVPAGGFFLGAPAWHTGVPVPGQYEDELRYLQRHGLLTDTERKALQGKGGPNSPNGG